MKLLEENKGNTSGHWNGQECFRQDPKSIHRPKMDHVKLKSLCTAEKTISGEKKHLQNERKCLKTVQMAVG
jgi:hypothetical protein